MEFQGVKNLIIDFGGVLIDLDRQRCLEEFKKLGLREAEECIGTFSQEGVFQSLEKGEITPPEFRDVIRTQVGEPVTDEQIDAAWNSLLVSIPSYKLDLLLRLRERYVVYLLSNTNPIHWEWACKHAFPWRTFRVENYFEKTYLSYEMKMLKPDPEIFTALLEDTGIDPGETLFIDDSPANCLTARELGFHTYTPQEKEDWSPVFDLKK